VCDPHRVLRARRSALAALAALAALLAACEPDAAGRPAPEPAPARWETASEAGLYRVAIEPRDGVARVGSLHAWIVAVETADGSPIRPARLAFDGGMPQHGHGFETAPRVTGVLEDGRFLVDGVRFHMPGEWTLRVDIVAPPGPDVAVFRVAVRP